MSSASVPYAADSASAADRLHRLNRISMRVLFVLLVIATCSVIGFPLFYLLMSSFKPAVEFYQTPAILPTHWTLDNYGMLFTQTRFFTYFLNSIIVAVSATAISLVVGGLGAYATSRFEYRIVRVFSRLTLLAYVLPQVLIVIPLYVYVVRLGMADTLTSVIVSTSAFSLPFTIWYMRAYFNAIPVALEESAMVDGCTRLQALRRVVLPLALPGIVATGVFAFDHAWNEFLFALVFTSAESKKVLTLGLATWIGQDAINSWGMLLAGAVLIALPVVLFYLIIQRRLIVGLSAGATKGE